MQDIQQQLLNQHNITIHSYENITIQDIPSLLKQINKITDTQKNSTIQLIDTEYICGQKHLNQAIAQTIKAFNEKQNFAKDIGLEICVRLSAQKQINKALKILGIKKQGNITVIYINTNNEQIKQVEQILKTRNDQLLEQYDEETIIETYQLNNTENITDQLNEKIALLTLQN